MSVCEPGGTSCGPTAPALRLPPRRRAAAHCPCGVAALIARVLLLERLRVRCLEVAHATAAPRTPRTPQPRAADCPNPMPSCAATSRQIVGAAAAASGGRLARQHRATARRLPPPPAAARHASEAAQREREPRPVNVPGSFYVDHTCIDWLVSGKRAEQCRAGVGHSAAPHQLQRQASQHLLTAPHPTPTTGLRRSDTCRWMAPATFGRAADGMSYVHQQPGSSEERHAALQALLACPT